MSVQVGIRYFGERTVGRNDVLFLLAGLEDRGPDYTQVKLAESLGMGFRGFLITPEDCGNQPLKDAHGRLITCDGRLDCRRDVAQRLGLPAHTSQSDVELVLSSYERFGAQCFDQLYGEFALALWDEQRGSLFLARSLCGSRPLYFIRGKNQLIWSSEFDDLVIKSEIDPMVNDAYAIGFAYYQPDIDQSPLENVSTVPPGTYVEIGREGQVSTPISTWHPEDISTLRLARDSDYEVAWREQVELAIADKLRARGPIWCELSGGLDSSTLILLADKIVRTQDIKHPITTTSCTYQTSADCDETYFITSVEKQRGRTGVHLQEHDLATTLGLEDIHFTGTPNPLQIFPGRYEIVTSLMSSAGSRILLSGTGGDELFWSNSIGSPELADLLWQGRLGTLFTKAMKWSQIGGTPLWRVVFDYGIAPVTAAWQWFPFQTSDEMFTVWTPKRAKERLLAGGTRQGLLVDKAIKLPSRRALVHSIRSAITAVAAGYLSQYHSIHFSCPFLHRQLIEFMLSIPMDQIARPGEDRSLMRRATTGLLPEINRLRLSKGAGDIPFLRVLAERSDVVDRVEDFEVCRRGFADSAPLAEAIHSASLGRCLQTGAMMRLFALERWLRSLSVIPDSKHAYVASNQPIDAR
jgi:asparagine synthase (glutamine-hydrolysing)